MLKKITLNNLSEYCIISMSDEQAVHDRVGGQENIIQAMVDFVLSHDCEDY